MYPKMLLYRLMSSHETGSRGLYLGGLMSPRGYQVRHAAAFRKNVEDLVAAHPDSFSVLQDSGFYLVFDGAAPRPTLPELVEELTMDAAAFDVDKPTSDFELLAAVMAKGPEYNLYGNGVWRAGFDALHLLVCGIDWASYEGVSLAQWSNFAGTFVENVARDVLEAEVSCRCDVGVEVEFGIEPPSVARVIVSLSAGQLEEIFDGGRL